MATRDGDHDLDNLDGQEWLEVHELVTELAVEVGLPAPWADPATPPEDRVASSLFYAEVSGRAHLAPYLVTLDPDMVVGRKVGRGNPKGRPPKDRPSDEALWREVRAFKDSSSRPVSDTKACREVARRHGLSERHVLRLTKPFRAAR